MAATDYSDMERAPTGRSTPNGYVPYGVAGYIVEGEWNVVLCYECGSDHPDVHEGGEYNYIGAADEWDAPGAVCEECHRLLDTNIIHYDD